jgi:hypothetical protein
VEQCLSGKVTEVFFDCYGDFEGFVLDCCGQRHTFRTSERGIGELALRACKDRLLLSVCYEGSKRHHPERIIVRC